MKIDSRVLVLIALTLMVQRTYSRHNASKRSNALEKSFSPSKLDIVSRGGQILASVKHFESERT